MEFKGELAVYDYAFSQEGNKEASFPFGKNSRLIIHTDKTATWKF